MRLTGAGRGLPVELVRTEAWVISVMVRELGSLEGLNSVTTPVEVTREATVTVGAELVKTKMPSEVLMSLSMEASGFGGSSRWRRGR